MDKTKLDAAANHIKQYGYLYCKKVLSNEMCYYITHALLRKYVIDGRQGDSQIPTALTVISHDIFLETIHEKIWPLIESVVGEEILPTYTYARLYSNGDELIKHTDRPACEISITVQLGRSHHYSWPIFIGGNRIDIAEGDGVIYLGKDIDHWREPCAGPNGYYSGQIFFHFVRKNGMYANQAGDSENRKFPEFAFMQNRTIQMEEK